MSVDEALPYLEKQLHDDVNTGCSEGSDGISIKD